MTNVHILAIDLAKRSFQICATSPGGAALLNRTVSRAKPEAHLREQAPCIVAMEACATSHFWGRFAQALGVVIVFVRTLREDAVDVEHIDPLDAEDVLCGACCLSQKTQIAARVGDTRHIPIVGPATSLSRLFRPKRTLCISQLIDCC